MIFCFFLVKQTEKLSRYSSCYDFILLLLSSIIFTSPFCFMETDITLHISEMPQQSNLSQEVC